jgi:hypothetical protein
MPTATLSGDYISTATDLGSVAVRRLWIENLVIHFYGSGTTWDTIFNGVETWAEHFSAGQTWIELLGATPCGDLRIVLQYSEEETPTTWKEVDNFQIFMAEIRLRFYRLHIYITNTDLEHSIGIEDLDVAVYTANV